MPAHRERFAAIVGDRLKVDEPLAAYTTLRLGGPADFLAIAQSSDELVALVDAARELGLPWRVFGRGSNLLVADRGVRGLVVRAQSTQVSARGTLLTADAGVSCANLATRTAKMGLAGFEFAVAIPGTIGGAVVQNAGAHGREMVSVLRSVEYLDAEGTLRSLPVEELELAYRTSRFKRQPRRDVVLRATLALERAEPERVAEHVAEIRAWRAANQPTEPSAGSIFTNPPGDYAGRLIEAAGLKGAQIGNAQISLKHANFIINLGGARAADVAALIDRAREEVERQFGVQLETEVEKIGEW